MPILFRYLLRYFLTGFVKTISVFIGLFLLIDGIESIRRFSQKPNFNATDITLLIVSRIPNFIGMLTPSMVLLTTLMVISRLARQNEITVMRASGISLHRLLIPFLLGGVLIAGVHALLLDQITPRTNRIAQKLEDKIVDRHLSVVTVAGDLWLRNGQQIIHAQRVDAASETMHQITIFTFDDENRLTARLEAQSAVLKEARWELREGIDYQFLPQPAVQVFKLRSWDISLDSARLTGAIPVPEMLTMRELFLIAEKLQQEGQDTTRYWVIFHRKLAAPAITLAAILLAFPFALSLPRSGGTTRSFVFGLLLGFALFVLEDLAMALGMGGRLPPILAAWAPILFFGSLAGFGLLHMATPRHQP